MLCLFVYSLIMLLYLEDVILCKASSDTLRFDQSIRNKETLVSAGGVFELGFFDTGGPSSNHYLGIWFKKDPRKRPIWVANRENPSLGESGIFTIRYDGNMVIIDVRQIAIIVNYGVVATSRNATVKILDSGNLILLAEGKTIWQSFDYPSDTFLPGMKLGWFNINTDHRRMQFLTSWISPTVPSSGTFALGLDGDYNRSRFNIWRGEVPIQHIGFWDGHNFSFYLGSAADSYNFTFVSNSNDVYLTFDNRPGRNYSWFTLTSTGLIERLTMTEGGISITSHTVCEGSTGENPEGCLLPIPSTCDGGDTFSEFSGSMPDWIVDRNPIRLGPGYCETVCRSNCSCTAYAIFRDDGSGCKLYHGDRKNLFSNIIRDSSVIYVRSQPPSSSEKEAAVFGFDTFWGFLDSNAHLTILYKTAKREGNRYLWK